MQQLAIPLPSSPAHLQINQSHLEHLETPDPTLTLATYAGSALPNAWHDDSQTITIEAAVICMPQPPFAKNEQKATGNRQQADPTGRKVLSAAWTSDLKSATCKSERARHGFGL